MINNALKHYLLLIFMIVSLFFSTPLLARGAKTLVIDNFEDGNITEKPTWFGIGNMQAGVQETDKIEFRHLEKYAMRMQGETDIYFIGGVGAYLGIDAASYKYLKLLIRGKGSKTGTIRIELYDDDNNNTVLERHPQVASETAYDDKFIHTLDINWAGWKVVIIPLSEFRDDNQNIGDNIFNPITKNGSGGLLQLQILAFSNEESGNFDIQIDSIKLYR
jgi:hypothetical protein